MPNCLFRLTFAGQFGLLANGMWKWFNVARRLSELEDMMLRLSKLMDDRDLDWQDMRARCKRLLDRTEKAARRVVESENAEPVVQTEGGNGTEMTASALLSPKQRLIQQQILRRRAGM